MYDMHSINPTGYNFGANGYGAKHLDPNLTRVKAWCNPTGYKFGASGYGAKHLVPSFYGFHVYPDHMECIHALITGVNGCWWCSDIVTWCVECIDDFL